MLTFVAMGMTVDMYMRLLERTQGTDNVKKVQ